MRVLPAATRAKEIRNGKAATYKSAIKLGSADTGAK
jgi:hypothetical protein